MKIGAIYERYELYKDSIFSCQSHSEVSEKILHKAQTTIYRLLYCRGIEVSRSASCTRKSRHKQKRARGSARARPELNWVSKKELLFCVCLRHTLCTSLARLPCGSTTVFQPEGNCSIASGLRQMGAPIGAAPLAYL